MKLYPRGFLLMEVFLVLLILSVVFVAFSGVLEQALKISKRMKSLEQVGPAYEKLIFEIENGFHPDFVTYGGRGVLAVFTPNSDFATGAYQYDLRAVENRDFYSQLSGRIFIQNDREDLAFDVVVPEGGVQ